MKFLLFLCVTFCVVEEVYLKVLFPFSLTKYPTLYNDRLIKPRVYGGHPERYEDFPYMVFVKILRPNGIYKCSASLIQSDWVLTAAHCVVSLQPKNVVLIAGNADMSLAEETGTNSRKYGIEITRAKQISVHPGYDDENYTNDIALVKLRKPFTSENIRTIDISFEKMEERKFCTLVGWGETLSGSNNMLHSVKNKEVSTVSIGCRYKENGSFVCLIHDGRGICGGDSGGPLVCEDKVRGLASHLYGSDQCGNSLEEYYTEISAYQDWVMSVINAGDIGREGKVWIVLSVVASSFLRTTMF